MVVVLVALRCRLYRSIDLSSAIEEGEANSARLNSDIAQINAAIAADTKARNLSSRHVTDVSNGHISVFNVAAF